MGFFDFLFKKKKKRILPERMNVKTTISTGPDYYTREYVNLLLSRPTIKIFGIGLSILLVIPTIIRHQKVIS